MLSLAARRWENFFSSYIYILGPHWLQALTGYSCQQKVSSFLLTNQRNRVEVGWGERGCLAKRVLFGVKSWRERDRNKIMVLLLDRTGHDSWRWSAACFIFLFLPSHFPPFFFFPSSGLRGWSAFHQRNDFVWAKEIENDWKHVPPCIPSSLAGPHNCAVRYLDRIAGPTRGLFRWAHLFGAIMALY